MDWSVSYLCFRDIKSATVFWPFSNRFAKYWMSSAPCQRISGGRCLNVHDEVIWLKTSLPVCDILRFGHMLGECGNVGLQKTKRYTYLTCLRWNFASFSVHPKPKQARFQVAQSGRLNFGGCLLKGCFRHHFRQPRCQHHVQLMAQRWAVAEASTAHQLLALHLPPETAGWRLICVITQWNMLTFNFETTPACLSNFLHALRNMPTRSKSIGGTLSDISDSKSQSKCLHLNLTKLLKVFNIDYETDWKETKLATRTWTERASLCRSSTAQRMWSRWGTFEKRHGDKPKKHNNNMFSPTSPQFLNLAEL